MVCGIFWVAMVPDLSLVANSFCHIPLFLQMQTSLQQMLTILQTQQKEIEQLRSELSQQTQSNEAIETLQSQLDRLEGALSSKVAGALSEHHTVQCILRHKSLGKNVKCYPV